MVPNSLRPKVFFPPFVLLISGIVLGITFQKSFLIAATEIHQRILHLLGPIYSLVAFLMVFVCFIVFYSPLGRIRIGGVDAKPELTRWQWFTITLCSTVACGLLFWSCAEPIFHYYQPPASAPDSNFIFALAGLILHWTLTPYAIYAVPALVFALNYHNLKSDFSFASCLHPLVSQSVSKKFKGLIDSLCLYSLVIAMAGALAAGILLMSGGLNYLFLIPKTNTSIMCITLAFIITFTTAAISGVTKGVRLLADWNVRLFLVLMVYVLCFADIGQMFRLSSSSLIFYGRHFVELSLWPNVHATDSWGFQWGVFSWAMWMSWAPVTALFLGRIAKGYTVREFIMMNFLLPALCSFVWISIFGTLALSTIPLDSVYNQLMAQGPESVVYLLMSKMPYAKPLIMVFVFTCFLSFVTAADANLIAMADLSAQGDHLGEKTIIKMLWGASLGLISYFTVVYAGTDGIKMLSNFSGIPALLLLFLVLLSLIKLIIHSVTSGCLKILPE
ncbi:MAG TPA: BCCT family transporter [Legionella sp.]|nr:BCCT family transporter [Legionella sp.]